MDYLIFPWFSEKDDIKLAMELPSKSGPISSDREYGDIVIGRISDNIPKIN